MKPIYTLIALLLFTSCVSKRKTVTEVIQTKTEEVVTEIKHETKQSISEWVRQLSGTIVITETDYYPTDTVPTPQRYGAIKAERKAVVQLNMAEQAKDVETSEVVTNKVATRNEDTHKETKITEKIKDHKSGVLRYIIIIFVISALFVVFLRPPGFPK